MCGCGKSTTQQSSSASATTSAPMRNAHGVSMQPPSNARVYHSGAVTDEARDARATHNGASTTGRGNDIPLRYRGTRALLVRGPVTGVGYACYPGDTIPVHERDVAQLIGSGSFIRAAS